MKAIIYVCISVGLLLGDFTNARPGGGNEKSRSVKKDPSKYPEGATLVPVSVEKSPLPVLNLSDWNFRGVGSTFVGTNQDFLKDPTYRDIPPSPGATHPYIQTAEAPGSSKLPSFKKSKETLSPPQLIAGPHFQDKPMPRSVYGGLQTQPGAPLSPAELEEDEFEDAVAVNPRKLERYASVKDQFDSEELPGFLSPRPQAG